MQNCANDDQRVVGPAQLQQENPTRRVIYIAASSALVLLTLKYLHDSGLMDRLTASVQHARAAKDPTRVAASGPTTAERVKEMMLKMDVRIYGSDSCPWSRKQIADLGIDSTDTRLFVDCEKHPSEAVGVEAYPTWRMKGKTAKLGYMSAETAVQELQQRLYSAYDWQQSQPPAAAPSPSPPQVEDVTDSVVQKPPPSVIELSVDRKKPKKVVIKEEHDEVKAQQDEAENPQEPEPVVQQSEPVKTPSSPRSVAELPVPPRRIVLSAEGAAAALSAGVSQATSTS